LFQDGVVDRIRLGGITVDKQGMNFIALSGAYFYTPAMKEKELERQLKALANRRRLAILGYLKRHESAPVGDIAASIHLSFKATSKHLGILTAANILERDQRSLQMFYRIAILLPPVPRVLLRFI
jgi:DNA-binding transcriptional ArsR family regulator